MTRAVNGTDMTVPAQDTLAWEALDAQEAQKVQARLERLLARHVARYTMGDSSVSYTHLDVYKRQYKMYERKDE